MRKYGKLIFIMIFETCRANQIISKYKKPIQALTTLKIGYLAPIYRISSYSCRGNYSFLEVEVRQVFKGGNYSREETIVFLLFVKKKDINRYCFISCNLDQAN